MRWDPFTTETGEKKEGWGVEERVRRGGVGRRKEERGGVGVGKGGEDLRMCTLMCHNLVQRHL